MRPLNIAAFAIGVVPVLVFLLTVLLSGGAPFLPPAREESRPAAAAPEPPQSVRTRLEGAAAPGSHSSTAGALLASDGAPPAAEPDAEASGVIDVQRDTAVYRALFREAATPSGD